MKFAEVIIAPFSAFGTPLKGDTIFGHFFWQLIYDPKLIKGNLDQWRKDYGYEPFAVFSSAFPRLKKDGKVFWLLPRPTLPLHLLAKDKEENCFERLRKQKEEKARHFMLLSNLYVDLNKVSFLTPQEAAKFFLSSADLLEPPQDIVYRKAQSHNSINRLSFTTGEGFSPYQTDNLWFLPGIQLSIFVLFREEALDEERLKVIFSRMGQTGFGRDASLGLGRFKVEEVRGLPLPGKSRTLYTLSPYVPSRGEYERIWYQPFVRFGRHGGNLALSGNPFKEPVLMADEGAVLKTREEAGPYVGRGVLGLSKAEGDTLHQGYSIVFPLEGLA